MDIYIWYTLLSALVGGVMGARDRLGEVYSLKSWPCSCIQMLSAMHTLFMMCKLNYHSGICYYDADSFDRNAS
jgi:hypothetical protein